MRIGFYLLKSLKNWTFQFWEARSKNLHNEVRENCELTRMDAIIDNWHVLAHEKYF